MPSSESLMLCYCQLKAYKSQQLKKMLMIKYSLDVTFEKTRGPVHTNFYYNENFNKLEKT